MPTKSFNTFFGGLGDNDYIPTEGRYGFAWGYGVDVHRVPKGVQLERALDQQVTFPDGEGLGFWNDGKDAFMMGYQTSGDYSYLYRIGKPGESQGVLFNIPGEKLVSLKLVPQVGEDKQQRLLVITQTNIYWIDNYEQGQDYGFSDLNMVEDCVLPEPAECRPIICIDDYILVGSDCAMIWLGQEEQGLFCLQRPIEETKFIYDENGEKVIYVPTEHTFPELQGERDDHLTTTSVSNNPNLKIDHTYSQHTVTVGDVEECIANFHYQICNDSDVCVEGVQIFHPFLSQNQTNSRMLVTEINSVELLSINSTSTYFSGVPSPDFLIATNEMFTGSDESRTLQPGECITVSYQAAYDADITITIPAGSGVVSEPTVLGTDLGTVSTSGLDIIFDSPVNCITNHGDYWTTYHENGTQNFLQYDRDTETLISSPGQKWGQDIHAVYQDANIDYVITRTRGEDRYAGTSDYPTPNSALYMTSGYDKKLIKQKACSEIPTNCEDGIYDKFGFRGTLCCNSMSMYNDDLFIAGADTRAGVYRYGKAGEDFPQAMTLMATEDDNGNSIDVVYGLYVWEHYLWVLYNAGSQVLLGCIALDLNCFPIDTPKFQTEGEMYTMVVDDGDLTKNKCISEISVGYNLRSSSNSIELYVVTDIGVGECKLIGTITDETKKCKTFHKINCNHCEFAIRAVLKGDGTSTPLLTDVKVKYDYGNQK